MDKLCTTPETSVPAAVPHPADLWRQALGVIQGEVPPGAYDAWFAHARGIAYDGRRFTIEVPSAFAESWLRDRYVQTIESTLGHIVGAAISLDISVAATPPPRPAGAPGLHAGSASSSADGTPPLVAPQRTIQLNSRYTFSTFVVGRSNEFAQAACKAVAERPGHAYSPLFIYGGVGLGKTHLIQAIGHAVLERDPHTRVHYMSAEAWMNDMVSSIQNNATAAFRQKYRGADYLLLDDIQFLSGKESTQLELFHTFNVLTDGRKQIVLTSDRPPHEIADVEERLISRFQAGLVADIQSPDLETRLAILRNRAGGEGTFVGDDITLLIANSVKNNVRELEGSLVRLMAYASLTGRDLTLDLARQVLRDYLCQPSRKVTVDQVQGAVIEYFSLHGDAMTSRRRNAAIAHPRQIAMYLAREMTGLSLTEIGRKFGGRDHTTVLHACEKIRSDMERDPTVAEAVARLRGLLTR